MKKNKVAFPTYLNKQASFNYHIDETLTAGLALQGWMCKGLREGGHLNLQSVYLRITPDNEIVTVGINLPKPMTVCGIDFIYIRGRRVTVQSEIKLLLTRRQIDRLIGEVSVRRRTLIPLKVYHDGKRWKMDIGVCTGKKLHDKRADDKASSVDRDLRRMMKTG